MCETLRGATGSWLLRDCQGLQDECQEKKLNIQAGDRPSKALCMELMKSEFHPAGEWMEDFEQRSEILRFASDRDACRQHGRRDGEGQGWKQNT